MQPNAPIVCFIILLGRREQDEREQSNEHLRRSAAAPLTELWLGQVQEFVGQAAAWHFSRIVWGRPLRIGQLVAWRLFKKIWGRLRANVFLEM